MRLLVSAGLLIIAIAFRLAVQSRGRGRDLVPAANGPAGVLRVDPASLDFGRTPLRPDFRWKLGIRNTSDHRVAITRFGTSCTCTSVTPGSLALNPGQEGTVELALDLYLSLADTPGRRLPLGDEDFAVSVAAVGDEGARPLASWTIRGRVFKSLDASEPELRFGDVLRSVATTPQTVRIAAWGEIARLVATCPDKDVVAAVGDRTSSGGRDLEVWIQPARDLGRRDALIRQEGEAADGSPLIGFVRAHWDVVRDVAVTPSRLIDGARRRGEAFRSRVLLASRTGAKVRVTSFGSDSPSVTIRAVGPPDSRDAEFEVETTIDAVGEVRHEAYFEVIFGDSAAERDRVTLPILGYGLDGPEPSQGR